MSATKFNLTGFFKKRQLTEPKKALIKHLIKMAFLYNDKKHYLSEHPDDDAQNAIQQTQLFP